ncbi:unnamed protein product [Malassezia sympodialis ATCC 42132]|uniref:uncharacterized protein n=1 Tax=Malassezia sympodialis (strain ATCC 42132) TaxID=1230383 RepID=UPI0002C1F825|nr:uncharacterized protein MSY001_0542 [Malassezia sympodialis ATCC 42132]CCU97836.1 unnamed protein product [Malassezia sympodialis ATCC 42132]|eukprot:XP_018739169.1 uncharacterized protein MSY001_0542 [Malassezia sympodialis ATCC 42132]
MGIPWIVVCTLEAYGRPLVRQKHTGSEDMDTLTFGTPILLKNLTASEQKKLPVTEINLSKALEELDMPMQQFIDLCMLLGCDYLDPIKGIGPKKALKLIREHKSLDQVLEVLQSGERMKNEEVHESNILADEPNGEAPKKRGAIQVPEFWPYQEARVLFRDPQVQDGNTVQDRVRRGCEKLSKAVGQKQQGRLDGFFTYVQAIPSTDASVQPRQGAAPPKRKNAPTPASGKAPRGKSARS